MEHDAPANGRSSTEAKLVRARQCIIRRWRLKRALREGLQSKCSAEQQQGAWRSGEHAQTPKGSESAERNSVTTEVPAGNAFERNKRILTVDELRGMLSAKASELEQVRKESNAVERRLRLALRSAEDDLELARAQLVEEKQRFERLVEHAHSQTAENTSPVRTSSVGVQVWATLTLDKATQPIRTCMAKLVSTATQARPAVATVETCTESCFLWQPLVSAEPAYASDGSGCTRVAAAAAPSAPQLAPAGQQSRSVARHACLACELADVGVDTCGTRELPQCCGGGAGAVVDQAATCRCARSANPAASPSRTLAARIELDRQRLASEIRHVQNAHQAALQRVRAAGAFQLAKSRAGALTAGQGQGRAHEDAARLSERVRRGMAQREQWQAELRRHAERCAQLEAARPSSCVAVAAADRLQALQQASDAAQAILRHTIAAQQAQPAHAVPAPAVAKPFAAKSAHGGACDCSTLALQTVQLSARPLDMHACAGESCSAAHFAGHEAAVLRHAQQKPQLVVDDAENVPPRSFSIAAVGAAKGALGKAKAEGNARLSVIHAATQQIRRSALQSRAANAAC